MGVEMNSICMQCQLRRGLSIAQAQGSDAAATAFARDLMRALSSVPPGMDSTQFGALAEALLRRHYPVGEDRLYDERRQSNRFALSRADRITAAVEASEDPVFTAIQYSILSNYIDFSALHGQVSYDTLDDMLSDVSGIVLDGETYRQFCRDMETAKKLLYLTDNAGEVVFDRIVMETFRKKYPDLEITVCVRGAPVFNDALRQDAEEAGIRFPVIDNGIRVGGTPLSRIGKEAADAINAADVIFAKGMGNVESMLGCGYNVYYAFLVKCERLMQVFDKPKMTPMFLSEKMFQ